jgi:hypothetical protein
MRNRKKVLTIAAVVLLAAGLAAGFVLAQDSDEAGVIASPGADTLMGKVASILGIEESALADAFEQARLELLDDAVAAGTITEEQAAAMRAGIETRNALRDAIDAAIESGALSEDQAELLRGRATQGHPMGQLGLGLQGRMQGFRDDAQDARGFGFMLRTPRGTMVGGIRGRCP